MLVVAAYAKLNLSLSVTARRPDGWHEIESVLVFLDWHDLIGVSLQPAAARPARVVLKLGGPAAEGVPADHRNLAFRAAGLLIELTGHRHDVGVWLHKRLPNRAGLGGGSADAAAVFRAGVELARRRGMAIEPAGLATVAATLGSDVPAGLRGGGSLRVGGRGEELEPLPAIRLHCVVAMVAPSSTVTTYGALLSSECRRDGRPGRVAAALLAGLPPVAGDLGSALEAPAGRAQPAVAAGLSRLRAAIPDHRWHLTGSGGAAFAIATHAAGAEPLAARVRTAGFPARACRTVEYGAGLGV